ncbi:unnamed protein product [Penicillium pancosmium]
MELTSDLVSDSSFESPEHRRFTLQSMKCQPVGWIVTAKSSSLDTRAKEVDIESAVNWIKNLAVAKLHPLCARTCIVDELGIHSMANSAADGIIVDSRRGSSSKQDVEFVEK